MNYQYVRQNPYLGACLFFCQKKFIEMAVLDGMAINLEADDQQKHVAERGPQLLKQWEEQYRADYAKMTNEINAALWSALWAILFVIAVSTGIAGYFLRISPSLTFDTVRFVTYVGSALVAWATLMELGGDFSLGRKSFSAVGTWGNL